MSKLGFVLFLGVMVLLIGQASATVNVVASNTVQASNDTNVSVAGGYVWYLAKSITPPLNTTGTYNASFWEWDDGMTFSYEYRKNGVAISGASGSSQHYEPAVTHIHTFSTTLNTTDTFELWVYAADVGNHVGNFRLMYDGEPINLSYTYTSTGINFTWQSNPSGYTGYNFMYNDYGGGYTTPTSINTNYSFVSAIPGQNITVRIYPYNTITGKYLGGSVKMLRPIIMGGTGYNWTANVTSWGNNTYARLSNQMTIGNLIVDGFDSNWASNWSYNCGATSWSLVGTFLVRTGGTASSWCAVTASYPDLTNNFQNSQILMKFNMSSNVAQEQVMPIFHASNVTETNRTYRAMLKHRNNPIYNYIYLNNAATSLYNQADISLSANTNYYMQTKIYSLGKNATSRIATTSTQNGNYLADFSNTTLTNGKVGFAAYSASGNPNVTIQKYYVRATDNNGELLSSGSTIFNQIDSGINGNVSQICLNLWNSGLIGSNNNVTIAINSSSDGVSYTGDTTIINANSSSNCYDVPTSAKKRFFIPNVTIQWNTSALLEPYISNVTYYIDETGNVSGYVKYPNGTVLNGAKVGYYQNWQTTGSDGYYSFNNVPFGNVTFVAGLNGYRANGDVLTVNATSISNNNISLIAITEIPKNNIFLNYVNNISWWMASGCYLNGHCNFYQLYDDNVIGAVAGQNGGVYNEEDVLSSSMGMVYKWGVNITPEYTERAITLINHNSEVLSKKLYNFSDHYDHTPVTYNDPTGTGQYRHDFPDWYAWTTLQSISRLGTFFNGTTMYSRWVSSVANINSPSDWRYNSSYGVVPGTNYTNNYAMMEAYIDYWRYINGYDNNSISRINNITYKFVWQTDNNGFKNDLNSTQVAEYPTTMYNILELQQALYLQGLGYNDSRQSNFNSTVSNMSVWLQKVGLQDGDAIYEGRNTFFTFREPNRLATLAMLPNNKSNNYYQIDRSFQKDIRYIGVNGIAPQYMKPQGLNYYDPKLGNPGQSFWSHIESYSLYWYAIAAEFYDPSIVEAKPAYTNLDDFNGSGVVLVNKNNYSFYMFSKYYPKTCGLAYATACNGSDIYPMLIHATIFDSSYPTIIPSPEITIPTTETKGLNFPYFNSGSQYVVPDSSWGTPVHNTQEDGFFINYTTIPLTTGNLSYYNVSLQSVNDEIHVKITFQNDSNSITNFRIPIDFVHSDNLTTANYSYDYGNLQMNYSRGTETVNITNVTSSQSSSLNISQYNYGGATEVGFVTYGSQSKTLITGNPTSFPVTIEYDMKISTTNVFNSILDQPPGVYSYSASPVNNTLGSPALFNVTFDQNLQWINWTINGVAVQQNQSVSSATYTNSTDVPRGTRTVNATGSNDQGNATMSWTWNSPDHPMTGITGIDDIYNFSTESNLTIYSNYTPYPELDGDTITFGTNATKGTFYSNNGTLLWNPLPADSDTYHWYINVTDGYTTITKNFTVVLDISIPPIPVNLSWTSGGNWINYTWNNGTMSYNLTQGTTIFTQSNQYQSGNSSGIKSTTSTTYVDLFKVPIIENGNGTVKLQYRMRSGTNGRNVSGQWYKNNVAIGNPNFTSSNAYSVFTQIINDSWNTTDTLYLRGKKVTSTATMYAQTPNMSYDVSSTGTGDIYKTDSFNVSVNGSWFNGSFQKYSNGTVGGHGYRDIQVWAYNIAGKNLSTRATTANTSVINNEPILDSIGNKTGYVGQLITIDVNATDADNDILTYSTSDTNGTINSSTGVYIWTPTESGIYSIDFVVNDDYGGSDSENIYITILSGFVPPIPTINSMIIGNFYKNLTWQSNVTGNITDGFNLSRNGTWYNGTATFKNTSTVPHGWINDTLYAWNSSGSGTLSSGITNDTQIPNNIPILSSIGNKNVTAGQWLNFTVSATDLDSDTITYASNSTKATINSTTGNFNWSTTGADVGTYHWNFNSSDIYGGVAQENITVTVNSAEPASFTHTIFGAWE